MGEYGSIPAHILEKFRDFEWGGQELSRVGLFKNFNDNERQEIYKIGDIQTFKPQSHIVIEGETSRGLYLILHGNVSVYKNEQETGAMHRIAYMEEGALFGELSLIDKEPRSATVVAESHSCFFALDTQVFENFLESKGFEFKSRFFKTCAEDMAERFRRINQDYITSQQLLWKYALRRSQEPTGQAQVSTQSRDQDTEASKSAS